MADLIEVVIDSLRVSLTNQQRIVILKALEADRYLPIWIGPFEAEAITAALQEIEMARPQTHDLLTKVFQVFKGQLQKVIISALKDDVFFATIVAESDGNTIEIDARPSDAIALALRAHVPILVDNDVMDEAAIEPEVEEEAPVDKNAREPEEGKPEEPVSKKKARRDKRLSVFEEYLKKRGEGKSRGADDPEKKDGEDGSPKPNNN